MLRLETDYIRKCPGQGPLVLSRDPGHYIHIDIIKTGIPGQLIGVQKPVEIMDASESF